MTNIEEPTGWIQSLVTGSGREYGRISRKIVSRAIIIQMIQNEFVDWLAEQFNISKTPVTIIEVINQKEIQNESFCPNPTSLPKGKAEEEADLDALLDLMEEMEIRTNQVKTNAVQFSSIEIITDNLLSGVETDPHVLAEVYTLNENWKRNMTRVLV